MQRKAVEMNQAAPTRSLDDLLGEPLSAATGQQLIEWARGLYGRIQRGDMMIGILSPQDARRAPLALIRAVQCGLPEAWLELATWHTTPPIDEPDHGEAERALRSAILAGVPGARLQLAELRWFYQREEAHEAQRVETVRFLHELLEENAGDVGALYLLGLVKCQGFGTAADPRAAVELQQRAAALGHANAMFELYVHYAKGVGVPRDDRAAFEAVEQAARAGHPRALYNMGAFHATGQHVPRNLALAVQWYEKAFDAGNIQAAVTLAVMYATGEGVEQDVEYANELFGQAEWLGYDVSAARAAAGLAE